MVSLRPSFDGYLDEYYGLSTDTKPTGVNVVNGSTFVEMDTSTKYIYDAGNKTWHVVTSSSGSGSGGADTYTVVFDGDVETTLQGAGEDAILNQGLYAAGPITLNSIDSVMQSNGEFVDKINVSFDGAQEMEALQDSNNGSFASYRGYADGNMVCQIMIGEQSGTPMLAIMSVSDFNHVCVRVKNESSSGGSESVSSGSGNFLVTGTITRTMVSSQQHV